MSSWWDASKWCLSVQSASACKRDRNQVQEPPLKLQTGPCNDFILASGFGYGAWMPVCSSNTEDGDSMARTGFLAYLCAITAAILSQVGGSWEDTIRWREESELAVTVGRLDSRKEHLKKWAGSVWRIGIEGSKNGDVIRKFRGAMDESMGALPFGLGRFWGGILWLSGPPRQLAQRKCVGPFFSLHCSSAGSACVASLSVGIWHLAGFEATALLAALTTAPYPDNCVPPAGCGCVSRTLALSLSHSLSYSITPLLASFPNPNLTLLEGSR